MIKRILILCTVLCMTNMMAFAQAKSVDKGQRGHHVQKIQTMLVHQGYLKDSADGIFGNPIMTTRNGGIAKTSFFLF